MFHNFLHGETLGKGGAFLFYHGVPGMGGGHVLLEGILGTTCACAYAAPAPTSNAWEPCTSRQGPHAKRKHAAL